MEGRLIFFGKVLADLVGFKARGKGTSRVSFKFQVPTFNSSLGRYHFTIFS